MATRTNTELKAIIARDIHDNTNMEIDAAEIRAVLNDIVDSSLNVDQQLAHITGSEAASIGAGSSIRQTYNVPQWLRDQLDDIIIEIQLVGAFIQGTTGTNPVLVNAIIDSNTSSIAGRTVQFTASDQSSINFRFRVEPATEQIHLTIAVGGAEFQVSQVDVSMIPSFVFSEFTQSTQRLYYTRAQNQPGGDLPAVINSGAGQFTGDPPTYNVANVRVGGTIWYRDIGDATGDDQLWAAHVSTLQWRDGTHRVVMGIPAQYVDDLEGAVRYDADQTLTDDQETRAQRNIGGPFAVNQPPGNHASEDPFAQWAARERLFFVTGSALATSIINEVPSGARIGINTRGGAAIQFPLFLNGQMAFGNSRSFVAELNEVPENFALIIRLFFVADTSEEQVICDGLVRLRRAGSTISLHGDTSGGDETTVEIGDLAIGATGTIIVEGYRQSNDQYVLYADSNFRSSSNPAQSGLNADPPTHIAFGIRAYRDALADGEHDAAMFAWDIAIFEPIRAGSSPTLTAGVRDAYFAAADRTTPYGLMVRESLNFDDTGFAHGSVFTQSVTGQNVASGATLATEFRIPIENLHGDEAHRIRVIVDAITPDTIEATSLVLLFSIGANEYVFGNVAEDGTFPLRGAHADDGVLRLRIRNDSANALTGVRVNAQGFDRVVPTADGVPDHAHDTGDQLEYYSPIEDAVGLAENMVVNFSRSIPVADIRELKIWGKPGHGSLTEEILNPSKNLVVTPLDQNPAAGQAGDIYVAGWTVNDQRMFVADFSGAAAPSGIPYSVFRFVRSSTGDPAGFVSGIKVVAVSGSQRNLRAIEMVLDA